MTDAAAPRRGVDVLNTSVTELMLLAIFFILLAFAIARDDLIGANADNEGLSQQIVAQQQQISDLLARVKELQKNMGMTAQELDEVLFKRKVLIDDLSRKNEQLNKQLAASNLKLATLEKALKTAEAERLKLKNAMDQLIGETGSVDALQDAVKAIKRLAAANNIDPDAPLDTVISALESRIGKLAGDADTLRQKMKAAGLTDKEIENTAGEVITARCWNPDNGRPDAVFNIFVRANGFRVTPAWPKVREYDATSSQWIRAMAAAGTLGIRQFQQLGKNIRAESEKRQPPCIFVANVRIDERDGPSAAQFKRLRDVAGRYFYIR